MRNILNGIKIIDLSYRLPGPYAGMVLSQLGAEVIKIEDHTFTDPFLNGFFAKFEASFINWYKELNQNKNILRFDFNNPEDLLKIKQLVAEADGLIMGLPEKQQVALGLTGQNLNTLNNLSMIEMKASQCRMPTMHDLNAMAETGLLKLHIQEFQDRDYIAPPFLPFFGATFGHMVATTMLALLIKNKNKKHFQHEICYLYDDCKALYEPFYSNDLRQTNTTKFLHNGAYPCYCIYRLGDGHYVALAAVEDKFWDILTQKLSISLPGLKRFDTSKESFQVVASVFHSHTKSSIEQFIAQNDVCLSLIN
jgi:alpha-methylacyl-CoA racemase